MLNLKSTVGTENQLLGHNKNYFLNRLLPLVYKTKCANFVEIIYMLSALISILKLKCPRCRKGNLLMQNPYQLKQFNKVNDSCPHCKLHFKIEPSFFYGSMYVSYGLGVAISITIYLLLLLLRLARGIATNFIVISICLVFLMPYINALSKVIWAGFFFKYDPEQNQLKN